MALIVVRGRNTNSYKFALLRALADWPNHTRELDIPKRWLAARFIEYFWPITLIYRLRQATDHQREPVVMRRIREITVNRPSSALKSVNRFLAAYPDEYEALCDAVASEAFRDVIPRLHTISGEALTPVLYHQTRDGLCLENEASAFLRDCANTVRLLAVGGWVRFTEDYTSAPRLFLKIEGSPPGRRSLREYATFLRANGGEQCFYCSTRLADGAGIHIDHVIPWAYVLEDRAWNLVSACTTCNLTKRDRLPPAAFLEKLLLRNANLSHPDLLEWQARNLDEHIRRLADECRADGFPVWQPVAGQGAGQAGSG